MVHLYRWGQEKVAEKLKKTHKKQQVMTQRVRFKQ